MNEPKRRRLIVCDDADWGRFLRWALKHGHTYRGRAIAAPALAELMDIAETIDQLEDPARAEQQQGDET